MVISDAQTSIVQICPNMSKLWNYSCYVHQFQPLPRCRDDHAPPWLELFQQCFWHRPRSHLVTDPSWSLGFSRLLTILVVNRCGCLNTDILCDSWSGPLLSCILYTLSVLAASQQQGRKRNLQAPLSIGQAALPLPRHGWNRTARPHASTSPSPKGRLSKITTITYYDYN